MPGSSQRPGLAANRARRIAFGSIENQSSKRYDPAAEVRTVRVGQPVIPGA